MSARRCPCLAIDQNTMTRVIKHVRHAHAELHTSANQQTESAVQVSDRALDEAIEETFPASDPPAIGGVTRLESGCGASTEQISRDRPEPISLAGSHEGARPRRREKRS